MLQALLVTFREGLESLLIVGVIAAYLRKTGRADLIRGVRIGFVISIATCVAGAYLWQMVPNQPLYEGIAALVAAVLVGGFLAQMMRMGRRMKGQIEARVARISGGTPGKTGGKTGGKTADATILTGDASTAAGARATADGGAPSIPAPLAMIAGIALVTTLLVTREGLEAVLYLGIQLRMVGSGAATKVGAALGLALAAVVAWIWSRYTERLNLGVVLKVTAVFLGLFLFQLVVYGVHELAESGVIEGSQGLHDATEIVGPDGAIGHLLSYSLLAAPLLYLVWSRMSARTRIRARPGPAAPA